MNKTYSFVCVQCEEESVSLSPLSKYCDTCRPWAAYNKSYYERNKRILYLKSDARRKKNPEKHKEYAKKSRESNVDL
jgi:hypothetical protein